MTDQQILEKAIKIALKNDPKTEITLMSRYAEANHHKLWLSTTTGDGFYASPLYYRFIFSPYFAKALWGDGKTSPTTGLDAGGRRIFKPVPIGDWKSHLQEMVIAEDPIKYLGENI